MPFSCIFRTIEATAVIIDRFVEYGGGVFVQHLQKSSKLIAGFKSLVIIKDFRVKGFIPFSPKAATSIVGTSISCKR